MRVSTSLVSVTGGRVPAVRAPFLSSLSSSRALLVPVSSSRPLVFARNFVTVGPNGEKLTQGLKANGLYDPAHEHGESIDLFKLTEIGFFIHTSTRYLYQPHYWFFACDTLSFPLLPLFSPTSLFPYIHNTTPRLSPFPFSSRLVWSWLCRRYQRHTFPHYR